MKDSNLLSIMKAITWRAFGTSTTWIMAFFLTGDVMLSTKFSIIECSSKIALFYIHERVWQIDLRTWKERIWRGPLKQR